MRLSARVAVVVLLVVGCGGVQAPSAAPSPSPSPPPPPPPPPASESTIEATDFAEIRDFILGQGGRQTYGNRFNNNPHFRFGTVDAYLNPEDGRNTSCDPTISGFDELMIELREGPTRWVSVRVDIAAGGLRVEPPEASEPAREALRRMVEVIRRSRGTMRGSGAAR